MRRLFPLTEGCSTFAKAEAGLGGERPSLPHHLSLIRISVFLVLIGFFAVHLFVLWLINKSCFLKYG